MYELQFKKMNDKAQKDKELKGNQGGEVSGVEKEQKGKIE